jgi:DNA-binding CsgD family transcriptional regulator
VLLRTAHQAALRLGATPFRRQVEALARRGRVTLEDMTSRTQTGDDPGLGAERPSASGSTKSTVPAGAPSDLRPGAEVGATAGTKTGTQADTQADTAGAIAAEAVAAAQARYGLSRRELEVWLLLPEGLTNNQIGQRLFISGKTASVHVTNILRKLGVKSRVQAIALAHHAGLVEYRESQE